MRIPGIVRTSLSTAVGVILALAGCDRGTGAPERDKARNQALLGEWRESLPSDVAYFAGSKLNLAFDDDSVAIEEARFTDVSTCVLRDSVRTCTDTHWSNFYRGGFTVTADSLFLDFVFDRTSAAASTGIERMSDAKIRIPYRIETRGGKTALILGSNEGTALLSGKASIRLER